jgi:hypothetical protein
MERRAVDGWIEYHGRIARAMTSERTALESALIPVSAYVLLSGVEAYRRWPDMLGTIAAAVEPAELGAAGRRPGNQVDSVHLWTTANMPLVGRQILAPFGLVDPATDTAALTTVLEFWESAAAAFRGDGTHQAADTEPSYVRPYDPSVVDELVAGCEAIADDEERAAIGRANAALTSFLFLLYFDTRAGYQDSGPYPLAGGRTLVVRDFSELGVSHFPWSAETCADVPYDNLTAAFVLDNMARVEVNDWGTTVADPGDYLPRTTAFGLFATGRDGSLAPIARAELTDVAARVKAAQRSLYRLVASMSRTEKIDAGAYVYFTFLRPFARLAGVEGDLEWSVPRDSADVYDAIATIERMPEIERDNDVPYYAPLLPEPGGPA